MRITKYTTAALATTGLLSTAIHADIVAGFDQGVGTTLVDQYTGTAGAGWVGGWASNSANGNGTFTGDVINTTPLNGAGNYLQGQQIITAVGSSNQQRRGTNRQFENFDNVNLSQDLSYSFDFRIDSATGWDASFDDILYIHSSEQTNPTIPDGGGSSWAVSFIGSDDSIRYRNGNTNVDTGLDFVVGTVYTFSMTSYAQTETYDLSIVVSNAEVFSATGVDWRGSNIGDLNFGGINFVAGVEDDAIGDNVTFSVDNIRIAPVPEPSSIGLILAGVLLACSSRRHSEQ